MRTEKISWANFFRTVLTIALPRSEERRVGKECRY